MQQHPAVYREFVGSLREANNSRAYLPKREDPTRPTIPTACMPKSWRTALASKRERAATRSSPRGRALVDT